MSHSTEDGRVRQAPPPHLTMTRNRGPGVSPSHNQHHTGNYKWMVGEEEHSLNHSWQLSLCTLFQVFLSHRLETHMEYIHTYAAHIHRYTQTHTPIYGQNLYVCVFMCDCVCVCIGVCARV